MTHFFVLIRLFVALFLVMAPTLAQPISRISARVVGPDGAPIEGAVVAVVPKAYYSAFVLKKIAPLRFSTDANGQFSMEPAKIPAPNLGIQEIEGTKIEPFGSSLGLVRIVAPGLPQIDRLWRQNAQTFQLGVGVRWRGRVQNDAGQPLEGVVLRLNAAQPTKFNSLAPIPVLDKVGSSDLPAAEVKSDAKGEFEFLVDASQMDAPQMGGRTIYGVLCDSHFARQTFEFSLGQQGVLTAKPGANVEGRIVDRKGRPVQGLQLSFADWFPNVETDAQGYYRFQGLPTSTEATQKLSVVVCQERPGVESELLTSTFVLPQLQAGLNPIPDWKWAFTRVSGQVVDQITKKPLPNVLLQHANGEKVFTSRADAQGRFEVLAKADSPLALLAQDEANEHLDLRRVWKNWGENEQFEAGILEMIPSSHVEVQVRDEDGLPAKGAILTVVWEVEQQDDPPLFYRGRFPADENGKVTFSKVPPGTYALGLESPEAGTDDFQLLDAPKIEIPSFDPQSKSQKNLSDKLLEIWVRRKAKTKADGR